MALRPSASCPVLLALSLILLFPSSPTFASAMDCLDYGDYLSPGGDEAISGVGYEIVVVGDIAYVGTNRLLQILDVSNPLDPIELSEIGERGSEHVSVHGDLATVSYVGDSENAMWIKGFQIIDVSDPAAPEILYSRETYPTVMGSSTRIGDVLWITEDGELRLYDVTDPAAPVDLGLAAGIGGFHEILVDGNVAYATGQQNLRVIDCSDPAAPSLIATHATTEHTRGVDLDGNLLALSGTIGYDGMLRILDVTDPALPAELGQLPLDWWGRDVMLDGDRAFVTSGQMKVIDTSTPAAPVMMGGLSFSRTPVKMARHGDHLVMSSDNTSYMASSSTVYTVDVSVPELVPVTETDFDLAVEDMVVGGDIAYVAAGDDDLVILDLSDPENPSTLAQATFFGSAQAVEVRGGVAFIAAGEGGLQIVSVMDPAAPVHLAGIFLGTNALDLELLVDHALVYDSGDIYAVDISSLGLPTISSVGDLPGYSPIALMGNTLYASGSERFYIHDVSNPEAMVNVGSVPDASWSANRPYVAGDRLAVGNAWSWDDYCGSGFTLYDIDDPFAPVQIDVTGLPGCNYSNGFRDLVATPNTIYTIGNNVNVFDASDPEILAPLTQLGGGSYTSLAVGNGILLMANDEAGDGVPLAFAPLHCDITTAIPEDTPTSARIRLSCAPNPFNPSTEIRFELPAAGRAELTIHAVDGRLVRRLLDANLSAGAHVSEWDGRDDSGRAQSSGVYIAKVVAAGFKGQEKLVLLK